MTKKEFMKELEGCLRGRLAGFEVEEILADYEELFRKGAAAEKSEEAVAEELGSPAAMARMILEKSWQQKQTGRFAVPEHMASVGNRCVAYILDALIFNGAFMLSVFLVFSSSVLTISRLTGLNAGRSVDIWNDSVMNGAFFTLLPLFTLFFIFVGYSFPACMILWGTNGFTPGKWLMKIRVEKKDGTRISLGEALCREVLIKGLASTILSDVLNLFSLVLCGITPGRKTVHDMAVSTRVVKADAALR